MAFLAFADRGLCDFFPDAFCRAGRTATALCAAYGQHFYAEFPVPTANWDYAFGPVSGYSAAAFPGEPRVERASRAGDREQSMAGYDAGMGGWRLRMQGLPGSL